MINIFLVAYIFILLFFVVAVFAIIYHLQAYQLNQRISTFTTLLFIIGVLIFLTFNIAAAINLDWGSLPIIYFS